jgi:hypothetical protein
MVVDVTLCVHALQSAQKYNDHRNDCHTSFMGTCRHWQDLVILP